MLLFVITCIILEIISQIITITLNINLFEYMASGKTFQQLLLICLSYIAVWNVISHNDVDGVHALICMVFWVTVREITLVVRIMVWMQLIIEIMKAAAPIAVVLIKMSQAAIKRWQRKSASKMCWTISIAINCLWIF